MITDAQYTTHNKQKPHLKLSGAFGNTYVRKVFIVAELEQPEGL